jgi:hypothetical protein
MDEAARIARNNAMFREANEQIRDSAASYGVEHALPVICECADPSCTVVVQVPLDVYAGVRADELQFVLAPGHTQSEGAGDVVDDYGGYVVFRKAGRTAEILES